VILDRESHEHDLQDFSFTFIELPKFKKKIEQISTLQEKWCYFFKHAKETSPEEFAKIIGKDVIIKKAYTELDRFHWTAEALQSYEQSEKKIKDYVSSLDYKYDEGLAAGERKNQIAIAENMLQERLPLKVIVKVTALSLEEVKKIQASIKKTSSKSVRSVKSKAPSKKK